MADREPIDEYEGEDVYDVRHVCRGFEGGLRKSVAANDPAVYAIGDRITYVVDAEVTGHNYVARDDDDGGLDLVHVARMATVAIISRDLVADELEAQRKRNEAAQAEREAAKAAAREAKRAARKAAKEAAGTLFESPADVSDNGLPDDLTEAEARALQVVG